MDDNRLLGMVKYLDDIKARNILAITSADFLVANFFKCYEKDIRALVEKELKGG